MQIASEVNLYVIEDCSQAHGAKYKGTSVGSIGHIGCWSFCQDKIITTGGEGGMVTTNDESLWRKMWAYKDHGKSYEAVYEREHAPGFRWLHESFGTNCRMTEIQAAIGTVQLKKLDSIISHRNILANFLHNELQKIDCLETFPPDKGIDHSYYTFPIKFNTKKAKISRSLFVKAVNDEFLIADGLESIPLFEAYVEPLYLNPIYQNQIAIGTKGFPFNFNKNVTYDYSKGLCPVAEEMYCNEMIISPIGREALEISDMKDLIKAIKKVLYNAEEIQKKIGVKESKEIYTPVSAISSKHVR